MTTTIISIGNSRGIRIPKPILEESGIGKYVELKVKKGEILVTTMTSPDFVPAMKLAAAIVTDRGGITSHAAIVSRELGIACIVGTERATKILKDGDLVEVDANEGTIRVSFITISVLFIIIYFNYSFWYFQTN